MSLHPMDDQTGFADERGIHDWFAYGSLKFRDAIDLLIPMGYRRPEAERIVTEWAEDLEPDHDEIRF